MRTRLAQVPKRVPLALSRVEFSVWHDQGCFFKYLYSPHTDFLNIYILRTRAAWERSSRRRLSEKDTHGFYSRRATAPRGCMYARAGVRVVWYYCVFWRVVVVFLGGVVWLCPRVFNSGQMT